MTTSSTENTVRFGLFELDLRTRQLTKNGLKIRLPQQPIQVLSLLLDRPGEIVTREELRRRLWPSDVFIDFDHGLNKSIQKLREALGDSATSPRYIETIPRVGYRFIARIDAPRGIIGVRTEATTVELHTGARSSPDARIRDIFQTRRFPLAGWMAGAAACVLLALGGVAFYRWRHRPPVVQYVQLTDFTDSAVAPALSPDGRMMAFIRGADGFLTSDRIYAKMLPNGEARQVTDDDREKYGLTFSPDGSEIAYTVLERSGFSTYEVSALGGEPHLLLQNAAGLVWLDPQRVLFSEIRTGIHMGVVTATPTRAGLREVYFPAHERGMAHDAIPSPDRRWALVVEMNGNGEWAPCRLVSLQGQGASWEAGPAGRCTSAGWSPDGSWMYFAAAVEGRSHLWRQRFPQGRPEQITFGPTEEDGVAVEPGGRALVTSVGVHESALWVHDGSGERSLSSEGEVVGWRSPPVFSRDASVLYYLLQRGEGSGAELWRAEVASGKSEAVFPGVSMTAFDLSPDGEQVVYTTAAPGEPTQLWLEPVNRSTPATKMGIAGARSPHFGETGKILFQVTEGSRNYLEHVNLDGSHRAKMFPYAIEEFQGVSPGRRWVLAAVPTTPEINLPAILAIPLDGGVPRRICAGYCFPRWSTDGKLLFVPVEDASRTGAGRSLAIPVGPGESLPEFPKGGIAPLADASVIPGTESVERADMVPGRDLDHYAWVNTTVHRNLYRVMLP